MRIVIDAAAQAEINEARDYYREHASTNLAAGLLAQIEHAVALLREYPELGTPVSKRLRVLPLRQFPYSLIYHLGAEALTILAVAHQRRRPGYWAKRR